MKLTDLTDDDLFIIFIAVEGLMDQFEKYVGRMKDGKQIYKDGERLYKDAFKTYKKLRKLMDMDEVEESRFLHPEKLPDDDEPPFLNRGKVDENNFFPR